MSGETNLSIILKNLQPILHAGEYVYCKINHQEEMDVSKAILFFREEEACTIVLKKEDADTVGLEYTYISSWITIKMHTSLEAVGLTSVISSALAKENISCNVVAAYFHDHIFTEKKDEALAMHILHNLSQ